MRHAADAADAPDTGGWLFEVGTLPPERDRPPSERLDPTDVGPASPGPHAGAGEAELPDAATEPEQSADVATESEQNADVATEPDRGPDAEEDLDDEWSLDTVAGAAEQIIRELAPTELARFPVVARRFFTDARLHRRLIRWSLSGAPRTDPLAYQLGGDTAEVVTGLVLTALSCAATGVLGQVGTRHHNGVTRWRRNRWAARKRLPAGPNTALPHLSSVEVPLAGQVIEEAAEDAGLDPDRARRLSILVLAALTRRQH